MESSTESGVAAKAQSAGVATSKAFHLSQVLYQITKSYTKLYIWYNLR